MPKHEKEQILFSCLGSSDPVRGEHDGAMLHIARHYRPSKIMWYITREMRTKEAEDNRFQLSIDYLKQQCPGYEPEILEPYYDDVEDASDFDCFYEPFSQILSDLNEKYPNAEIVLNLSSGTPQMKMTLALLAQTLQYRVRCVQVKNYEKRSGTADRTTSENYELELELELNEDALPYAENRCQEPALIGLQRQRLRAQVEALLKRYDYESLEHLGSSLPAKILPLIKHLSLRSAYDFQNAIQEAKMIPESDLYPALRKTDVTYPEYQKFSEYLLTLKLMQRTQRYTDLVIRLNPLVIRLQQAWLEHKSVDFSRWGYRKATGELFIQRDRILADAPGLLTVLDRRFPRGFQDSVLNIIFCNCVIDYLGLTSSSQGQLFLSLERLNANCRNSSAHTLDNVTEQDIVQLVGMNCASLIKQLIGLLQDIYPQHYQESLFSIYDDCNRAILAQL